ALALRYLLEWPSRGSPLGRSLADHLSDRPESGLTHHRIEPSWLLNLDDRNHLAGPFFRDGAFLVVPFFGGAAFLPERLLAGQLGGIVPSACVCASRKALHRTQNRSISLREVRSSSSTRRMPSALGLDCLTKDKASRMAVSASRERASARSKASLVS